MIHVQSVSVVSITSGGVEQKAGIKFGDKIKICVEFKKTDKEINRKYLRVESPELYQEYIERIKSYFESARRDNNIILLIIQRTRQL